MTSAIQARKTRHGHDDRRPRQRFLVVAIMAAAVGLLLLTTFSATAYAQDDTAANLGEELAPDKTAKVVSVRSEKKTGDNGEIQAGLDDLIYVKVENLPTLLADRDGQPIHLYINGMRSTVVSQGHSGNELVFRLVNAKTSDSKEFFAKVLLPLSFTRKVTLGVGLAAGQIEQKDPMNPVALTLEVLPVRGFWTWVIAFAFTLGLIFYLGKHTTLLRESGKPKEDDKWSRFSLARTQMAFWFVLIVGAFAFIWLVNGEMDSVTGSVVALAGISASTALGAVVVDASKTNAAVEEMQKAVPQKNSLEQRVQTLQAPGADAVQKAVAEARLKLSKDKVESLEAQKTTRPYKGFLQDILSDANGVSLHRLQIVVWTLVLGVIFVTEIYQYLSMPEFSETLLALMGISSGTYLGFKFPEKMQ